ncbi:hypothetical protein SH2C18_41530 [Clostridium sediminicola]
MFQKLSLRMKLIIFFILSIIVFGIIIGEYNNNNGTSTNFIQKIQKGD